MKYFIFLFLALLPLSLFASDWEDLTLGLKSADEDSRYDAVMGLGELADPRAVPLLKDCLGDQAMAVRHGSVEALSQIGGGKVEELFRGLCSSLSIESRRLGAIGLGQIGCGDASFDLLVKMMKDENWQVRWASVYALGALGDFRAKDVLGSIEQNDTNEEVRKAASFSLRRLTQSIRWYYNLQEVQEISKSESRKILILFFIPSSVPCKMLVRQILSQPEMVELSRKFYCVKANPKVDALLAEKYAIGGVPSWILTDGTGAVLDRVDGLVTLETLQVKMKSWLGESENVAENEDAQKIALINAALDKEDFPEAIRMLEELLNEGKKGSQILFYLGYSYGRMGEYQKSVDALERLFLENPDFEEKSKALYCLSLGYLGLGKVDHAKKILQDLKHQFKDQPMGETASQLLSEIEKKGKK